MSRTGEPTETGSRAVARGWGGVGGERGRATANWSGLPVYGVMRMFWN